MESNENKKCLSCGGSMSYTDKELARRYKQEYEQLGIIRWVIKRNDKSPIEFARNESFEKIKKKLKRSKHAEFIHISEFKPD